ncbi:PilN domain-containing protein [Ferrimonas pelagia]|uniref:PilN domain-containing protein n=1 Tax=Ferrimonas pelagia TaxID=1177826 RepID=A0ABP9FI36_9GAMM
MAHINLLPWREAQRARARQHYLLILGGVAGVCVLVLLLTNVMLGQLQQGQQARNAYLQQEIARLDAQIAEIKRIKEKKAKLLKRIDVIKALQQERHLPVQLMNELAQVMVPGVYLTRLEIKGSSVSLQGFCDSNNHLANMMRQVEGSKWLAAPKVHQIVAAAGETTREHAFKLDVTVMLEDPVVEAELAEGQAP